MSEITPDVSHSPLIALSNMTLKANSNHAHGASTEASLWINNESTTLYCYTVLVLAI